MVELFFCSLFINPVGVKHLRHGWCGETQDFIRKCFTLVYKLRHCLWGKIPDFIRKCFTLVYKLRHSLWGKIPDLIHKCLTLIHKQWELITLSLTDKQGEALGYKTLAFSHHISPKCFAPTGEEFDVDIQSI